MTLLKHLSSVPLRHWRQPGSFLGGVIATAMVANLLGGDRPARAADDPASQKHLSFQERLRASAGAEGVRARVAGLPVKEIGVSDVVGAVLNHNLDILQAGEVIGVARATVTQSDAVFDPTIFSSLSYTNRFTVQRQTGIGRFYDDTDYFSNSAAQQQDNQNNDTYNKVADQSTVCRINGDDIPGGTTTIDSNVTSGNSSIPPCFKSPRWIYQDEDATGNTLSQHKVTGSIGIGKQFVDGPVVQATLSTTWRKKGYFSQSGSPALSSGYYPDGLSYDPYGWDGKLFWTSSVNLSVSLPLPFTKGFGEEGNPTAYSRSVAEYGVKQATYSEKSQINQRLSDSLQAYWDLVRTANNIQIRDDLRKALGERQVAQKRLLDSGVVTRYDVNQVEVQLANLDLNDETDWSQLVTLSNRLLTLLAADQRAFLVPANPEAALTAGIPASTLQVGSAESRAAAVTLSDSREPRTISLQYASLNIPGGHEIAAAESTGNTSLNEILINHPDIKLQEQGYEISKVTLAYRENQDLPDLSVSASAGVAQSDSVFGYGSIGQSLARLIKPDTANFTVALHYRYPLWNHATEAAVSRARIEERQAWDRVRDTRQSVTIAIDRATADLKSAQVVVRQSGDDVSLAQFAFDRAKEQRDLGLISEFEVLNRYSALLSARLNRSTALANVQKAHVRLLAAQGILESRYGR